MSDDITERDFTAQVIELARMLGWRTAHFRPAWTGRGWRTPVQGDGKGFPDLVMVKGERVVVAELKCGKGRQTADQKDWLEAFHLAGIETHLWYPADFDDIVKVLQ